MNPAVQAIGLLLAGGAAMTVCATLTAWWLEPGRRIVRALEKALGQRADTVLAAPARGQGAGLALDVGKMAIVRGHGDHGLVFELDELIGVELIFDGQVAARAFRNEGRRPLDHIDPTVERVMLRLVFDDVRDPEFELLLWTAEDPPRPGQDGPAAVQAARRWFTRLETVLRR